MIYHTLNGGFLSLEMPFEQLQKMQGLRSNYRKFRTVEKEIFC